MGVFLLIRITIVCPQFHSSSHGRARIVLVAMHLDELREIGQLCRCRVHSGSLHNFDHNGRIEDEPEACFPGPAEALDSCYLFSRWHTCCWEATRRNCTRPYLRPTSEARCKCLEAFLFSTSSCLSSPATWCTSASRLCMF